MVNDGLDEIDDETNDYQWINLNDYHDTFKIAIGFRLNDTLYPDFDITDNEYVSINQYFLGDDI